MPLTLHAAIRLLSDHDLLSKVVRGTGLAQDIPDDPAADVRFSSITYDTRTVGDGSLLVRKGRFRPAYLDGLDERGLAAYVAETGYADHTDAPGLIVHDASKALSLLASEFYGRPQDELTVIGITGTKGKTTTAYLTHAILNAHSDGRCALFSSVDNCLDGRTYEESVAGRVPDDAPGRRQRHALPGHGGLLPGLQGPPRPSATPDDTPNGTTSCW